ncbi:YbdD/YjiX family protein [Neobacillus sp. LXY-1]|uniref:YbdD/YjiX family protein n=1 Tax=Neobacillus sp. LXY-1 TaxID=3379133 RepID=UPI003EDF5F96
MLNKLKELKTLRKQFISLLVGVPSYETYVTHMQTHHPNDPVKSRKEFFCEAQEARYNAKGGKVSRCC